MYSHGWFKVAFERDLKETLTPAAIGTTRLVLVRTEAGIRAYHADCPHRGAHLAYGGRLYQESIVCPFHGYRIGLGCEEEPHGFQVRAFPTLVVGGLIFVRLSTAYENGLTAALEQLAESHFFVPGFEMHVRAPAPLIVENGFDNRHFRAVHHIETDHFEVREASEGSLCVESVFAFPETPWLKGSSGERFIRAPFVAHAYSPCLIVSHLSGASPYTVITGATPTPEGGTVIRLSLALPTASYGNPPPAQFYQYLLEMSRNGLEDDRLMWDNLSPTAPHRYVGPDAAVMAFQHYCRRFEAEQP